MVDVDPKGGNVQATLSDEDKLATKRSTAPAGNHEDSTPMEAHDSKLVQMKDDDGNSTESGNSTETDSASYSFVQRRSESMSFTSVNRATSLIQKTFWKESNVVSFWNKWDNDPRHSFGSNFTTAWAGPVC